MPKKKGKKKGKKSKGVDPEAEAAAKELAERAEAKRRYEEEQAAREATLVLREEALAIDADRKEERVAQQQVRDLARRMIAQWGFLADESQRAERGTLRAPTAWEMPEKQMGQPATASGA